MLSETDLIILWRAALAAALGLLIGWERRVTGSAIKARTIGLAALTAASLTALAYVVATWGEWPVLSLLRRPTRRTADVPQPTPTKVSR